MKHYNLGNLSTFNKRDEEYKMLDTLAMALTQVSPNCYRYDISDCYVDYGSNYMWTTVIGVSSNGDTWQAINPKEWIDYLNKDISLEDLVDEWLHNINNPDRIRE